MGLFPPDLVLAIRSAFDRSCVDDFWNVWSAGAEAGLLRAYQRAGGPVPSGLVECARCGVLFTPPVAYTGIAIACKRNP